VDVDVLDVAAVEHCDGAVNDAVEFVLFQVGLQVLADVPQL
jgi:hypothetical protein